MHHSIKGSNALKATIQANPQSTIEKNQMFAPQNIKSHSSYPKQM